MQDKNILDARCSNERHEKSQSTVPCRWVSGCGGRRAQAEINCDCGSLYLIEIVIEVEDGGLELLVTEKYLDLADVEAAFQPAFGGEAAKAVEGVARIGEACGFCPVCDCLGALRLWGGY